MSRHRADDREPADRINQDEAWERFLAAHADNAELEFSPRHRDRSWSRGVIVLSVLLVISVLFFALALALPHRVDLLKQIFLVFGCGTLIITLLSSTLAWVLRAR